MQFVLETLAGCAIIATFVGAIALVGYVVWRSYQSKTLGDIVRRFFKPLTIEQLSITERQFPGQIRADLQRALDTFLKDIRTHSFTGVTSDLPGYGGDFASLFDPSPVSIGTDTLTLNDIDQALEEMLFRGGSLNLKLLGAEERLDKESTAG